MSRIPISDEDLSPDYEGEDTSPDVLPTFKEFGGHENPTEPSPRTSTQAVGPVKMEAKETSKKIEENVEKLKKNESNIHKVVELLQSKELEDPISPSSLPDEREVEFDQEYTNTISQALDIISVYKEMDEINIHMAHIDAAKLQALLVYLAKYLAIYQARFGHLDRSLDTIRAKHFMRAKEMAQQNKIRITDMEAKEIAKMMSSSHVSTIGQAEMFWRYLYNIYMSIMSFVQTLDHAASREYKANFEQARTA